MIQPDISRPSPNSRVGQPTGRLVVIHATRSGVSGNPREFEGTLNWLSRTDVGLSAHWVIDRDGKTARMVDDNRSAIHAGEDNPRSWGIELCQGVESDGFTAPQLAKLAEVCRGYRDDFGVPAVHSTQSSVPGFIGHQETTQGRRDGKSDPGRLFPWGEFMAAMTAPAAPALPYRPEEGLEAVAGVVQALAVYSGLPWYPGIRLRDALDESNRRRARDFAAWVARELG